MGDRCHVSPDPCALGTAALCHANVSTCVHKGPARYDCACLASFVPTKTKKS